MLQCGDKWAKFPEDSIGFDYFALTEKGLITSRKRPKEPDKIRKKVL